MSNTAEAETARWHGLIGADGEDQSMPEGLRKPNGITTLAKMPAFISPVFADWTTNLHPLNPQDVIANNVSPLIVGKMQQK